MKDKIFEYLKDKNILLLGYGREGKSTYHFIRKYDSKLKLGIADIQKIDDEEMKKDTNVTLYCGNDYLNACYDYDIIIKGPGVIIKDYLEESVKKKITCQTDLFLKFCTSKTIGITGTKGKSTTVSLLCHILRTLNQKVVLMGNIGIPCFDMLEEIDSDTICVLELGCHQLEYMKNSPNIAVILNIYEEHLDHYLSIQNYVDAKKNIYLYQNSDDYVLLPDSPYLKDFNNITSQFLLAVNRNDNCFFLTDEDIHIKFNHSLIQIPITSIKTVLKGKHNLYNILVCLTIIKILGLDINQAVMTLSTFKALPHRMEYIGTYDGILFYDDSIATSIPSVIFAVESLKKVDTIIIGGMDRGLDYRPLVDFLESSKVENIILLPATNQRIQKLFLEKKSLKNIYIVSNMDEAVKVSKEKTLKDKICLLSPAAASYGFYKNFEERGNHFRNLVFEDKIFS